jgi:tetratricopeptide (TPR) repeat protein
VFFFEFALPQVKVTFARFWIFGLLAVEAFLQLAHAPRYNAGGFNVAHVGALDDLAPGRVAVGVIYLLQTYLFAAIALGAGGQLLIAVAAVLYAWVYLSSQLDSYQHHYLTLLVLALATMVPWFRPPDDGARPVRAWALRLILIQIGIVYLWAAIAKLDGSWLDGSALAAQLTAGSLRSLIERTIGFPAASQVIVAVESFLAVGIWCRPLWPYALPLGVALHVGIAFTNFEIELFSWLMVALYLLIVPDRWFIAAWRRVPLHALTDRARAHAARGAGRLARTAMWLLALGVIAATRLPIDGALPVAGVAMVLVVVTDAMRLGRPTARLALGPTALATGGLVFALAAASDVISDYYRYWGGSSRRLGDEATARHAYGRMTEVAPEEPGGHYQLGKLLLRPGAGFDEARGLAALDRAAALEPSRARATLEKARHLWRSGRRDDALAAARAALRAEPGLAEARRLLDALEGLSSRHGGGACLRSPRAGVSARRLLHLR